MLLPAIGRVSEVSVEVGEGIHAPALLGLPANATGLVLFAHGSGSGRHSPRNRFVADVLNDGGMATLLLDLLTFEEDALDRRTAALRFDIGLLGRRLIAATHWVREQPQLQGMSLGYFGASTGAAAALVAAAALPQEIAAVVSRGGRPDLAAEQLPRVEAPTLLIVGGADHAVIELNLQAYSLMNAKREIAIVPGATHLFEEPGALEEVARLSRNWFQGYLTTSPTGRV
jgi:putative phosphoribosyl transferase